MLKFLEIAQIIIPPPPVGGVGFTLAEIAGLVARIGSFFTSIAVIFGMIAIIISGIIYMKAGAEPTKVTNAKTWFWNSLLGSLIVLGVGAMMNTLANIISRDFFCTIQIISPFYQKCLL